MNILQLRYISVSVITMIYDKDKMYKFATTAWLRSLIPSGEIRTRIMLQMYAGQSY